MNVIANLPQILAVIAGTIFLWPVRTVRLAMASSTWRPTKGLVLKSYLDESSPDDGGDVTHSAHVRYSYKIASNRYESTRLTYRPTSGLMFSDALSLLDGITQGREVAVFYNPRNPSRAVLVPGSSTDGVVHLGLSFVLFAVTLWAAI